MAVDNTSLFKQCVEIYTDSLKEQDSQTVEKLATQKKQPDYHVANSEFYSKATSIHNALTSLITLLNLIRPQYLLANSKEMSEEQKLMIDTEIKLKIQKLSNKVKNLQDVQSKLESMSPDSDELSNSLIHVGFLLNSDNQNWNKFQSLARNLISMGDYSDYISVRNTTLRTIFSNVVNSLALLLQNVLLTWNDMHDKRIERMVQLKKSTLNTASSYKPIKQQSLDSIKMDDKMFKLSDSTNSGINLPNSRESESRYITDSYENLQDQLPQQELLQLQAEQDSLAEELKKGTLDTVTQIEETMMDVASMVREIGMQLSMQNENITLLDQHKDEIVGNVKSGNTVLIKANERNSQNNKTLAWAIFFAALILLIVDYIL